MIMENDDSSFQSSYSFLSVNSEDNLEISDEETIQAEIRRKASLIKECVRKISKNYIDYQASYLCNIHKKKQWANIRSKENFLVDLIWNIFKDRNHKIIFLQSIVNSKIWLEAKDAFLLRFVNTNVCSSSILEYMLKTFEFGEKFYESDDSILHRAIQNENEKYVKAILSPSNIEPLQYMNCSAHLNTYNILFIRNANQYYPKELLQPDTPLYKMLIDKELEYHLLNRESTTDDIEQLLMRDDIDVVGLLERNLEMENISEAIIPLLHWTYDRRDNIEIPRKAKLSRLLFFDRQVNKNSKKFLKKIREKFISASMVVDILRKFTELLNDRQLSDQLQVLLNDALDFDCSNFEELLIKGSCFHVDKFLKILRERRGTIAVSNLLNKPSSVIMNRAYLHKFTMSQTKNACIGRVLIEHGSCVKQPDVFGYIPLHYAVIHNKDNLKLMQALTETNHLYDGDCGGSNNCVCGIESLICSNQSNNLPKHYAKYQPLVLQFLNGKEKMETIHSLMTSMRNGDTQESISGEVDAFVGDLIRKNKENKNVFEGFFEKILNLLMESEMMMNNSMLVLAKILKDGGNREKYADWFRQHPSNQEVNVKRVLYELLSIKIEFFDSKEFARFVCGSSNTNGSIKDIMINFINIAEFCSIQIVQKLVTVYASSLGNSVHLDHMGLTEFRKCFFEKPNQIELLDMRSNRIQTLQSFELPDFFQLTKLNLRSNMIKSVTKDLFALPQLQKLYLDENKLTSLPERIKWSESLTELYLQGNKLKALPSSISNSNIETLNVSANCFQTLPACICDMRMLQYLYFDDNPSMLRLPKELGKLPISLTLGKLKKMPQLPHPERELIENTNILLHRFQREYYSEKRNKEVIINIIGDNNSIKKRVIELLNPDNMQTEDWPARQIHGIRDHGLIKHGPRLQLRIIEHPDTIEGAVNHFLLVKYALYVYVTESIPSKLCQNRNLIFWLDTLSAFFNKMKPPCQCMFMMISMRNNQNIKTAFEHVIQSNSRWNRKISYGKFLFFLNPTKTNRKKRQVIRKQAKRITYEGSGQPLLGGMVFGHYIHMQRKIRDRNEKFMSEDGMRDMLDKISDAERQNCSGKLLAKIQKCWGKHQIKYTRNDYDNTIKFLKDTGKILHFNDSTGLLSDYYFTDVSWFNTNLISFMNHEDVCKLRGHISLDLCKNILPDDISHIGFIKFLISIHVCIETFKDHIQLIPHLITSPDKIQMEVFENACSNSHHQSELCRVFVKNNIHFETWTQVLSSVMKQLDKFDGTGKYKWWREGICFFSANENTFFAVLFFHGSDYSGSGSLYNALVMTRQESPFHSLLSGISENPDVSDNDGIVVIVKERNAEKCEDLFGKLCWNINKSLHKQFQDDNIEVKELAGYKNRNNNSFTFIPLEECYTSLMRTCFSLDKEAPQIVVPDSNIDSLSIKGLFPDYIYETIRIGESLEYGEFEKYHERRGIYYVSGKKSRTNFVSKYFESKKAVQSSVDENFRLFHNEVMILKSISSYLHENIVKFLGVDFFDLRDDEVGLGMVFELAPYKSLDKLLRGNNTQGSYFFEKNNQLHREILFLFVYQIINAIGHLHEHGILHCDIKTYNILVFNNRLVKLCDFGSVVESGCTVAPPMTFVAPEIELGISIQCLHSLDIWQFAIVLYEMVFTRPFYSRNAGNFSCHLRLKNRPVLDNGRKDVPVLCKLISTCWDNKPMRRPASTAIMKCLTETACQLFLDCIFLTDFECSSEMFFSSFKGYILLYFSGNADVLLLFDCSQQSCNEINFQLKDHINLLNNHFRVVELIIFSIDERANHLLLSFVLCILDRRNSLKILFVKIQIQHKFKAAPSTCIPIYSKQAALGERKNNKLIVHLSQSINSPINSILKCNNFLVSYFRDEEEDHHYIFLYSIHDDQNRQQRHKKSPQSGVIHDLTVIGNLIITVNTHDERKKIFVQRIWNDKLEVLLEQNVDDSGVDDSVKIFSTEKHFFITVENQEYFLRSAFTEKIDYAVDFSTPERIGYSDGKIQSITSVCHLNEFIFIGTSTGSIFIYSYSDFEYLKKFQPYENDVIKIADASNKDATILMTYGLNLKENIFGEADDAGLSKKIEGKLLPSSKTKYPCLLLWHVPENRDNLMVYPVHMGEK